MKVLLAAALVGGYEITRALTRRWALFALRKFWAYELRREMRN